MQQRHVTWASWAAGFAFFAAADTALGTGAVRALAELCLTDAAYDNVAPDMAVPGMPMAHTGHAVPWLIAGGLLGSFAGFGSWSIAQRRTRAPWAPKRRPILAGLALIAGATGRVDATALADAWNAKLDPEITIDDAQIALARFETISPDARRMLMKTLTDTTDRAAFICIAVRLLRDHGDRTGAGLAMMERIATDMGMSGLEIFEHWDRSATPSRVGVAIGEARVLGAIATRTAIARGFGFLSGLEAPLGNAVEVVRPIARRAGRAALRGFVHAFSAQRPARADDQLAGLRRRFQRRGFSARLQTMAVPARTPFRREVS